MLFRKNRNISQTRRRLLHRYVLQCFIGLCYLSLHREKDDKERLVIFQLILADSADSRLFRGALWFLPDRAAVSDSCLLLD